MTDVKISELPSASSVNVAAYIPVSSGDFTEKFTVEDVGSINIKQSVRLATTTNIGNLFQILNIDGITVSNGDRILVKDQTFAEQNGIYIVSSSGNWTRATDFDSNSKVKRGSIIYVLEGNQNRLTTWTVTSSDIDLGNQPLNFNQIGSSNVIISRNFIRGNSNENLLIAGGGSGSVQIENIIINTRTISTEPGNNLSIITNSGSLLINRNSGNGVTLGNIQIRGDTITPVNADGNIVFSGNTFLGNILINNNIISSNNGNVIINNVLINGNNITAASGNVSIGNFLISDNSIRTLNGDILLTYIGSNLVLGGSQSRLGSPLLLSGNFLFPLATAEYVDTAVTQLDAKYSVRVATTSNISLSTSDTPTIDGTNIVELDRILVKNQTNGIENGIYSVGTNVSAPWTRSFDALNIGQFNPGLFVFVEEGITQKNTGWLLTNPRSRVTGNAIVDSSYDFTQFAGPKNDVEVMSVSSDIFISDNSKKFQICELQTNQFSMFLQTQNISISKEIIVKNSQTSFYQLDVYNGSDTSNLLNTILSGQTSLFVFDGTNWQVLLSSSASFIG